EDGQGELSLTTRDQCTAEDFSHFPETLYRWHHDSLGKAEEAENWPTAIRHLDYLLTVSPVDPVLRFRRGHAWAELGKWRKAQADLAAARDGGPHDVRCWYLGAVVHLAQGDRAGYRRLCRDMLARFGTDVDMNREAVFWTIALADQGDTDD